MWTKPKRYFQLTAVREVQTSFKPPKALRNKEKAARERPHRTPRPPSSAPPSALARPLTAPSRRDLPTRSALPRVSSDGYRGSGSGGRHAGPRRRAAPAKPSFGVSDTAPRAEPKRNCVTGRKWSERDATSREAWGTMGIVGGTIVCASRGATRTTSEKRTRTSRFREEAGSEQSGKCSSAGLQAWWAPCFREGAEQD